MGDHLHHPGPTHPHSHGHAHSHSKKDLVTRREFISSGLAMAALAPLAFGQEQTRADMAERFRQMSEQYEAEGLAAPFRGITTNGSVLPNLFEISPTGASTEPVRNAAEKFMASLTSVQLARTMFPVDDIKWRKWMNQHFYVRQGISLQEMTDAFGHRVHMAGRSGHRLRHHAAVQVEHAGGEISRFAHGGGKRGADHDPCLFLHDRDEAVPHDLAMNLGQRIHFIRHHASPRTISI